MTKQDVYQRVTERIVAELEAGRVPWDRGWSAVDVPRSLSTGKPYQGINVLLLGIEGRESPYWGTYNAIREHGGQVRKGEKGTGIVFWKLLEKQDKDTGDVDRIPFLRAFTVFNTEQADGPLPRSIELPDTDPIESAELIFEGMPNRPEVKYGGDDAYYSPALDYVQLPRRESFRTPELFYATAFHELTHSTGHASRLDRKGYEVGLFGSESYAKEELVAELGAAFLMGIAGLDQTTNQRSAAYLAGWSKRLDQDPKLIVKASGAAQKAANYIADAAVVAAIDDRDREAVAA